MPKKVPRKLTLPTEIIASKIYFIRGQKIMLDQDLAKLYGVETAQLKRAVRRNRNRFPDDFMFELSKSELNDLRCQIGTSKWGGTRYIPFAFTEQGVAMLSGVLNSDRAIKVNIQIMRTFTQLRNMLANHEDLKHKIEAMEKNMMNNFGSYSKRLHSCWRWMKSRERRLVISKKARLNMAIASGKIEYRLI